MGSTSVHARSRSVWGLARRQHGVVTSAQLRELGFSAQAIAHRVRRGRLHRVHRGVYAVGSPEITQQGRWMAAVLSCGEGAVLSHGSAAALWGMRRVRNSPLEVSVPRDRRPRRPGVKVHRTSFVAAVDVAHHDRIPVTSPARTLIDLATCLDAGQLERAVNEADRLGLVDPERLRSGVGERGNARGAPALRKLLDRLTFRLTDSELEREFLRIVRLAELPMPDTGVRVSGSRSTSSGRRLVSSWKPMACATTRRQHNRRETGAGTRPTLAPV